MSISDVIVVGAGPTGLLLARGRADDLVATGTPVSRLRLFGRLEVRLDQLPTRFPYVLMTPRYQTEKLLLRRAEALGVHFEHGVTVTGLTQDARTPRRSAWPVRSSRPPAGTPGRVYRRVGYPRTRCARSRSPDAVIRADLAFSGAAATE
jgi:2-polyprenyl-6-methoxyphenol hydroxylase-like FAD-dependent oxidoreductase